MLKKRARSILSLLLALVLCLASPLSLAIANAAAGKIEINLSSLQRRLTELKRAGYDLSAFNLSMIPMNYTNIANWWKELAGADKIMQGIVPRDGVPGFALGDSAANAHLTLVVLEGAPESFTIQIENAGDIEAATNVLKLTNDVALLGQAFAALDSGYELMNGDMFMLNQVMLVLSPADGTLAASVRDAHGALIASNSISFQNGVPVLQNTLFDGGESGNRLQITNRTPATLLFGASGGQIALQEGGVDVDISLRDQAGQEAAFKAAGAMQLTGSTSRDEAARIIYKSSPFEGMEYALTCPGCGAISIDPNDSNHGPAHCGVEGHYKCVGTFGSHSLKYDNFDPNKHYKCQAEHNDDYREKCGHTFKCSEWGKHVSCRVCGKSWCDSSTGYHTAAQCGLTDHRNCDGLTHKKCKYCQKWQCDTGDVIHGKGAGMCTAADSYTCVQCSQTVSAADAHKLPCGHYSCNIALDSDHRLCAAPMGCGSYRCDGHDHATLPCGYCRLAAGGHGLLPCEEHCLCQLGNPGEAADHRSPHLID